jgi:putative ATP-binding cassette transporter
MPNALPETSIATLEHRLSAQLRLAAAVVKGAPERVRLYVLAVSIVLVIVATAVAQVELNAWHRPFYDAIERKDAPAFGRQLLVFFGIAGILLILNVSQRGLGQMIRLRLRELATRDLIRTWMSERRAARISRAGEIGLNPDQRIHADAQHLAEVTTDLGVGLVQSSILLASFIGVLWVLSRGVVLELGGRAFGIPGYMVWAALLYSLSGSLLSWQVGRPLIRLEATRYAREADLRVTLVRGAAQADDIALSNGEPDEERRLLSSLEEVVEVMRRTVFARVRLTWVTAGYGWVALVAPIIVAAPGYFGGDLSFGELMMVVGAFNQVQQALRWFVDNTDVIADWRATLARVTDFRGALLDLDRAETERLERRFHPHGRLALDDIVIRSGHGHLELSESHLEVAPGERVLVLGRPGTGKSTLFLSIAGLWSRGSGRISLPPAEETMFLSQRPFVPTAALRAALTKADPPPGEAELRAALERVGLGHLAAALDQVERWDHELTIGEQERLAYARLLLARPRWVVCDEVLDPLDDANEEIIRSIFITELAESAVVNVANSRFPEGFYDRVVRLIAHPAARAGGRARRGATDFPAGSLAATP